MLANNQDLLTKPPKRLVKPIGRALCDFKMLKEGDRVLLAVSGGKDSLSLFHLLRYFQRHAPVSFELAVITIDPKIESFDPSVLKDYFAGFEVNYFFERFDMVGQAQKSMRGDSFCAFCSRIKRGLMYKTAREQGYNVLALGQHLDDLSESLMMSLFHNGKVKTMKANYINDAGDIRIIRPLVYTREAQLAYFANAANLPVIMDNCPACFSKPTERYYFKQLLQSEEKRKPNLYKNLLNAMKPMLDEVNA